MYLLRGTGGASWTGGLWEPRGYDSRRSRLIHFLITEKYMVLPAAAEFNLQPRQTAAESALYGETCANRWREFLPAALPQARLLAPPAAPLLYPRISRYSSRWPCKEIATSCVVCLRRVQMGIKGPVNRIFKEVWCRRKHT